MSPASDLDSDSSSSLPAKDSPCINLPRTQPRPNPPPICLNSGLDNILSMISDHSDGPHRSISRSLMGGRFSIPRNPRGSTTHDQGSGLGRSLSLYRQKQTVRESSEFLLQPPKPDVPRPSRMVDNGEGSSKSVKPSPTVSKSSSPSAVIGLLTSSSKARCPPRSASATSATSTRTVSPRSRSRRSSWTSETSLESWSSPFADLTDEQCRGGDIEDAWQHTQSASKWNIVPDSHMLLYPEEVENDDALHNPNDYDRDDIGCGRWTIRGLINISGLILVTLGVVMTFLGWPVM